MCTSCRSGCIRSDIFEILNLLLALLAACMCTDSHAIFLVVHDVFCNLHKQLAVWSPDPFSLEIGGGWRTRLSLSGHSVN